MRKSLYLTAVFLLSACFGQRKQTYFVDALVTGEALLWRFIIDCRNNPGELRHTANCRNTEAANGKLRLQRTRQALGG